MILTPKNWNSFQHYKNRSPAWIKLHRGLLDDFDFCCLPTASRALAPFLWLLASEYEDGEITASLDELAFRLRMAHAELVDALGPLIEKGFFNASEPLADCKQDAILEKEREEEKEDIEKRKRESEKRARADDWPDNSDDLFWNLYPHKVGKPKALAKLNACRRRGIRWIDIIGGLRAYIHSKPPDRQWLNPETFINQERWLDQPAIINEKSTDQHANGHNAILAAATRKARELVGDGAMAGPADEDEFSFGSGINSGGTPMDRRQDQGATRTDDGRETEGILDGEIIPPDKASSGIPNGQKR